MIAALSEQSSLAHAVSIWAWVSSWRRLCRTKRPPCLRPSNFLRIETCTASETGLLHESHASCSQSMHKTAHNYKAVSKTAMGTRWRLGCLASDTSRLNHMQQCGLLPHVCKDSKQLLQLHSACTCTCAPHNVADIPDNP